MTHILIRGIYSPTRAAVPKPHEVLERDADMDAQRRTSALFDEAAARVLAAEKRGEQLSIRDASNQILRERVARESR